MTTYSSADIIKASGVTSGVTLRKLQWWQETGLIVPAIVGHKRQYERAQLSEVCLTARLLGKGLKLKQVRRVITSLRRQLRCRRVREAVGERLYLITDGRDLSIRHSQERALAAVTMARGPVVVVVFGSV